MKHYILDLPQGSPAWLAHRAKPEVCNASELAVAMGISTKMRRDELVKAKATGIATEHGDFVEQRVFAPGHEFEAIARPWAEEIKGEELYSSVFCADVDGLILSASLDGHTMLGCTNWEHKQLNAELAASLDAGIIPDEYHPQMEQGLMCNPDAERCLFMASSGNRETMRWCWYYSNPELRAKIVPTWKQLMADVAAYVPTATEVKPTGKAPEALPALLVQVTGMVTASNLAEFKAVALGAIQSVNRELTTDAHFADAEKAVKWCSEIETRIKATKDHALSQTASIDELFRAMDEISAEARRVRLDLDKLVKARKESIKGEIVAGGVAAFAHHIHELNAAMPAPYMPPVPVDFGGCIRGLKSVDSIRNAVNSELARAKIAASEIATRIHTNVAALKASGLSLPDAASLVLKAPDDLAAVLAQRVAAAKAAEEAQRARILAQEQARLEAEARAKVQAEARAAAEAERKVREAAEAMARQSEQAERQRAHAAQVEADRIAREQAEALSAAHIRAAMVAKPAIEVVPIADTSARMTLGQINERLSLVSVSVAGLQALGFEPVAQVKAGRFYRECDLPAIAQAIARHDIEAASLQPA
jgi:predicted phage-related endonuclease